MGAGYSMKAQADQADVYIYEDVGAGWFGGVSAKQFAADLKALGAVTTINLHINSFGGEVFEGMAIYRQLVDHPAKVVSHIDGIAASIASVIAMAGDEILITESGFVMVHEASGVAIGGADDMRKLADLLDSIGNVITELYVARTGQTTDQVKELMAAETWMTAQEAVDKGFATSVVENMRIAAHFGDTKRHRFQHAPEAVMAARATVDAEAGLPALASAVELPDIPIPNPIAARVRLQGARLASAHAMRGAQSAA